tara:strand:+ start:200 stop:655 length:456 start_codon:yes stop_codon:yes gene_type:complete
MSILASVGMWAASLFSSEKAGDVALKIVDRVSGTDWTPQQQAQFMIDYQKATAHQSVMRRVVVCSIVFGMAFFGFGYWLAGAVAQFYIFFSTSGETIAQVATNQNLAEIRVKPLLVLQNDMLAYMKDVLNEPFTYAVSFYLVIGVAGKVKR